MTLEQSERKTFSGTIANGSSETITVETGRSDEVVILVDDGSTGGAPAEYTLTERVYIPDIDDYQFYDEVTGSTARSFLEPTYGIKGEFEFTNTSGSDSTYRITITAWRKLD
jgi:hypothetical protein